MRRVAERLGLTLRVLRLLPALALVAVQVSMAGMVVVPKASATEASATEASALAALSEMLGGERIVLCTPDGRQTIDPHGDHAEMAECPWCQAFSATTLPDAPVAVVRSRFEASDWAAPAQAVPLRETASACHPCRAPPAPT